MAEAAPQVAAGVRHGGLCSSSAGTCTSTTGRGSRWGSRLKAGVRGLLLLRLEAEAELRMRLLLKVGGDQRLLFKVGEDRRVCLLLVLEVFRRQGIVLKRGIRIAPLQILLGTVCNQERHQSNQLIPGIDQWSVIIAVSRDTMWATVLRNVSVSCAMYMGII